jgi:transcriptional regulator with XRE-family HTH domain
MDTSTSERVAGRLIREIRHQRGLKQVELARASGVPTTVLSVYEHGRRQPAVAALAQIAASVGMEVIVAPAGEEMADVRRGQILEQVLDLAEQMPYNPRRELSYPPLMRRRRAV